MTILDKTEKPLTELEQDLLQSAQDMLAHFRGEKIFPTYPPQFCVAAVASILSMPGT